MTESRHDRAERSASSPRSAAAERRPEPGARPPLAPPVRPGPPPPGPPPGSPRAAMPGRPPGGSFIGGIKASPGRMSLRLRLTLLYGGMFFVAGALLLVVTYVIVSQILNSVLPNGVRLQFFPSGRSVDLGAVKEQTLHMMLGRSLLALIGVGVLALVLGFFVADRALGPLQKVTATARQLSESTLHERIALEGPEDEVKELADTFDAMLERLSQAFDSQRRFVANASHELRTPLAINRTLLEVALTDPAASEDLKAVGRTLLATNARHERLIDGLLLLARTERELTTRTPVDLSEVATTVLESVRKGDDVPDVTVTTELTPARTIGDPVLLEHLVVNLVENAIKHNVEDGEVFVRTGVLDGFAACQVENTGPTIPVYEVDRLFEPFRRLNTDRIESAKGAGLGLSIVRSVVNAHRGSVFATPRAGGGLIVTVRLPPAAP
ncbi:MAG TPA: HAMP domain-containing sensor histidine kinase [Streptosporangiaceae bacterium]|nr:HAMP domain-containing sensor histidine kinase [Streptosporangiaceae bacterium]